MGPNMVWEASVSMPTGFLSGVQPLITALRAVVQAPLNIGGSNFYGEFVVIQYKQTGDNDDPMRPDPQLTWEWVLQSEGPNSPRYRFVDRLGRKREPSNYYTPKELAEIIATQVNPIWEANL